ncbi:MULTISPECIES: hypothetical protein [Methylorubrum]|uniref:hypothetical protein n=1 Tax=Methylorubrum TaxID=2282523 RepID=UPI00209EE563|nr:MULTISPECIES: hypothetical protein [Methylorubrum]MCP1547997.1 CRISPR/Cas system Type II protein with McrA/HNH and RuvC-like nuclease domain [Methylorubrum zatmanii]MCP1555388.1 CRISPR/Cas system Type II protein with McrA/HNH and RuvC-like nuclease domain [Methylorubrum extorquens]MCP1578300.1 CRISPR/Cas system Type II protein with McrA/HNH and RuvC-like nuclease domain [Methylorubrum extorquens]
MCSLCGVLGIETHWTDAVARPGTYSRNDTARERRLERTRRIRLANRILSAHRLTLSDFQGRAYMLATATGKVEMIDTLAHLWPTAERLSGRAFDPLDEGLLAHMHRTA